MTKYPHYDVYFDVNQVFQGHFCNQQSHDHKFMVSDTKCINDAASCNYLLYFLDILSVAFQDLYINQNQENHLLLLKNIYKFETNVTFSEELNH